MTDLSQGYAEGRNWKSENGNWGGQDRDSLIELREVEIKPGFLAPLGMTAAGKAKAESRKQKAESRKQKADPSPRFANLGATPNDDALGLSARDGGQAAGRVPPAEDGDVKSLQQGKARV